MPHREFATVPLDGLPDERRWIAISAAVHHNGVSTIIALPHAAILIPVVPHNPDRQSVNEALRKQPVTPEQLPAKIGGNIVRVKDLAQFNIRARHPLPLGSSVAPPVIPGETASPSGGKNESRIFQERSRLSNSVRDRTGFLTSKSQRRTGIWGSKKSSCASGNWPQPASGEILRTVPPEG
ncbi:hypothetical protein F6P96_22830 (plasmid) [Escherichia coli]|nr:hypothetical protein F6P96_22830 [Escherichia coli]